MDLTNYPNGANLTAYITSCGLDVPSGLSAVTGTNQDGSSRTGADDRMQAAVDEFEQIVNWFPFLSKQGDETLTFDAPGVTHPGIGGGFFYYRSYGGGRYLDLECGLLSVTSLTSVNPIDNSIIPYVEGIDYVLKPFGALRKGQPYTIVEFTRPVLIGQARIVIQGKVGYCDKLKANVWQKLVEYGAYLTKPELSIGIGSGLAKIQDITYVSGTLTPLGPESEQWYCDFVTMAEIDYKRITF